jgi:hypothetical protein
MSEFPPSDDKKAAAALDEWRAMEEIRESLSDEQREQQRQELSEAVHSLADLSESPEVPNAELLAEGAPIMIEGEVNNDPNMIIHRGAQSIKDDLARDFENIAARANLAHDAIKEKVADLPTTFPPPKFGPLPGARSSVLPVDNLRAKATRHANEKAASDAIKQVDQENAAELAAARKIGNALKEPKTYDSSAWTGRGVKDAKEKPADLNNTPDTEKEPSRKGKLGAWLQQEKEKIEAQAERFGGGKLEKFSRYLGDKYNERSKWGKIAVGLGLGAGIAAGTAGAALSMPFASVLVGVCGGVLTAQRTLAGLGMFNKIEKHLDKVHEGNREGFFANQKRYQWIANQPELVRSGAALIMAAGVAIGSREAIGYLSHYVGEHAGEWLKHHWPSGSSHAQEAAHATPADKGIPLDLNRPPFQPSQFPGYDTSILGSGLVAPDSPDLSYEGDSLDGTHIPLNGDHLGTHALEGHAHHDATHHLRARIHHPKGLSVDAREKLETEFLNKWQLDHGGTTEMPTAEQINAYIAEHTPTTTTAAHTEHFHALNAHRVKMGLPPIAKPSPGFVTPETSTVHSALGDHLQSHPGPSVAPVENVPSVPAESVATHSPDLSHASGQDTQHNEVGSETTPIDHHDTVHPESTVASPEVSSVTSMNLEQGDPFTNLNNVPIDPTQPAAYGFPFEGQKIVFISGGGTGDQGLAARMDFLQKHLALDTRFWGKTIYFDTPNLYPGDSSFSDIGSFNIDTNGVPTPNIEQPTFWDQLLGRNVTVPRPNPNVFTEKYDIKT